jgi:hypothetical protein
MYVTPVFDGWTLVFGNRAAHGAQTSVGGLDVDAVHRLGVRQFVAELSARFGTAWRYGQHPCIDGWSTWCTAQDGEVTRFWDSDEPDDQVGSALPAEDDVDAEDTATIAGRTSVNPALLGPQVAVSGHGVLAVTACGRQYNRSPRGAVSI